MSILHNFCGILENKTLCSNCETNQHIIENWNNDCFQPCVAYKQGLEGYFKNAFLYSNGLTIKSVVRNII